MKRTLTLCGPLFLYAAMVAHATPVLIVGQPGNNLRSTPTKPTPLATGSTLLNFDSLTPGTTYSTYTTNGVSISSPDTLTVIPYSTQSGPNELYDNSADGSANIRITLTTGVYGIGIGIADSDPVSLSIQALGLGGVNLGSPFLEDLSITQSLINTGNSYFFISDTIPELYGLRITQSSGSPDYSGLAMDDLQLAPVPEPSSLTMLLEGFSALSAFSSFRLLKRS